MIWRLLASLVLPRSWPSRVWPEPPISMAYFSLKLRQEYVPAIADLIYAPNPLMKALGR